MPTCSPASSCDAACCASTAGAPTASAATAAAATNKHRAGFTRSGTRAVCSLPSAGGRRGAAPSETRRERAGHHGGDGWIEMRRVEMFEREPAVHVLVLQADVFNVASIWRSEKYHRCRPHSLLWALSTGLAGPLLSLVDGRPKPHRSRMDRMPCRNRSDSSGVRRRGLRR